MSAPSALNPGVERRELWAWAMYDFANSGYTTVVLTAVFNAYFVSVVAGNAPWATLAWTAALSVSYAIVMVAGPFLGAWADAHAAKKRVLLISTAMCVAGTLALAGSGPGAVAWAVFFVIVSNVAYAIGENIVAAFLPEIARPESLGKVSGWGWSLGYFGGILALAVSLAWVMSAASRGSTSGASVPGTMVITAVIFALAAAPTFLFLRERATPQPMDSPWKRLLETARNAASYRDLRRFLICILLYQAGITAVISLAAIYAEQAMKFTTQQTITLILVVNLTAAIGAFGFGYLQDAIGHVRAVALTLVGWIVMVVLAGLSETATTFWIAANLAGLCMGSSQAAGRAIVGYLAPPARVAEFFGLWGLAVKAASIFGPLTYGAVTWAFPGNHRLGIFVTGIYFVVGLVLLRTIDVERGRRAALQ